MMPMLPPSHMEELARECFGSYDRLYAARHIEDPDAFRGDRSLSPDPIFMALRRLVTTGPIGAVRVRFERWFDAREDRRSRPADAVTLPAVGAEPIAADDAEPRIAA